jgi:hypothetical protein
MTTIAIAADNHDNDNSVIISYLNLQKYFNVRQLTNVNVNVNVNVNDDMTTKDDKDDKDDNKKCKFFKCMFCFVLFQSSSKFRLRRPSIFQFFIFSTFFSTCKL